MQHPEPGRRRPDDRHLSGYRHGDDLPEVLDEAAAGVQTPRHEPHLLTDLDLLAGGHLPVEAAAVVERHDRHLQRVRARIDVVARARQHAPARGRARGAHLRSPAGRRVQHPAVANNVPRGGGPGRARATPEGPRRTDQSRPAPAAAGSKATSRPPATCGLDRRGELRGVFARARRSRRRQGRRRRRPASRARAGSAAAGSRGCAAPSTPVRATAVSPGPPSARSTRAGRARRRPGRPARRPTAPAMLRRPPPARESAPAAASATSRAIRDGPSSSVNDGSASRARLLAGQPPAVAQLLAVARARRQCRQRRRARRPEAPPPRPRHRVRRRTGRTWARAHEHGAAVGRDERVGEPQRREPVARRRGQLGAEQVAHRGRRSPRSAGPMPPSSYGGETEANSNAAGAGSAFARQRQHRLGRERHRILVVRERRSAAPRVVGTRSAGQRHRTRE